MHACATVAKLKQTNTARNDQSEQCKLMADLDLQQHNLAEGLQRRAQWHLSAQQWQEYLETVADLVTLYSNDNQAAHRVAELMSDQGQDIAKWLDLVEYAQHNLVQAIEQAQLFTQKLVTHEQNS